MEVDIESQQDFNKSLLSSSINLVGPRPWSTTIMMFSAKYEESFQFISEILKLIKIPKK